ncbi:hypothetical protein QKU48_gp1403 [Fadolivirus algeromassiliense]|uniref:Uncharacterized protein n=1 Tax=Fadolivirus FV1/VV64 TaxID=3070911 RepID=A0A7D3R268_9VIRU|nr:hypothetical protein QKU48_gp1403 [Fadolivirus algeromassiliense]QKF94861.1 hypothetical protein Fadolivirus_1_1403 [Fadolivirus FV1/VV64]
MSTDNLCDGSLFSEAVSCHILTNMLNGMNQSVDLFKGETAIRYHAFGSKRTDFILSINNEIRVAVEVKRVDSFNGMNQINQTFVNSILDNANEKSLQSNVNVLDCDAWDTQILHILTSSSEIMPFISNWFNSVDVCGFSWVFVTVIGGSNNKIF